jgi:hypothetical protein
LGYTTNQEGEEGEKKENGLQEKEFLWGGISSYQWAPLAQPLMAGMALHVIVSVPLSTSHGTPSVKLWRLVQPWQTPWLAAPSTVS